MDSLMEAYEKVHLQIRYFQEKIADCQNQIRQIDNRRNGEIPARITNLKEHLKKIDEYQLKIEGFLKLAEKHMTSRNVLTIEAPPGYRVNLNRLKTWSMMIDPMSEDDPYAQRVYLVSKCDLHFLNQKKEEFTDRIAQLEQDLAVGSTDEIKEWNDKIQSVKEELAEYISGEEVKSFAAYVCSENEKNIYTECPAVFSEAAGLPECWIPGAYGASLNVEEEQRRILKRMMGDFYDEKAGRVYMPMERIPSNVEFAMTVSCVPARKRVNEMDAGIRNLIFNVIDKSPAGRKKVYVIDAMRQNSSLISSLKQVEGSFALQTLPRNQEQIQTTLEELVSSFNDIDDVLENYDTVCEYNQHAEEEKKITRSLVVLVGWPDAFDRECGNHLKRIITNYERYGISLVIVRVSGKTEKEESFGLSEYAGENIIHISMSAKETAISFGTEASCAFSWYPFRHGLNEGYVNSLTAHSFKKNTLGTEYTKRIDMSNIPHYTRGKKDIVVPYGVDSRDQVHEMMFGNENFAAYLMGASGSGKSTLLHTIITGIIRNYHPDDVELWLADFKMSEFAQYIDPLPPHVKYILLDESQELVYDLIDRLTEKMMERQRFFMQHRDMKKVENVPSNIYMPVIFVILDEFSIMSQSVAESEVYKLKLQNLLAKGRALGIKFIFSSQTFIRGVGGLTQTAKDQIQMRIAMKNSYEEIDKTLELSSNVRTEQVKNWMDALPPHYALLKYRDGDHMSVKRLQVMYFAGSGEAALEPQRNMIRQLKNTMKSVSNYEYGAAGTYVEKNPVVVDGNAFDTFDGKEFADYIRTVKESGANGFSGDEMLLSFGTPRLMVKRKPAVLSAETRENILLIARSAEQACAASILLSAMKSYQQQNGKIQIWTYGKNRLYMAYRQVFAEQGFEVMEGMDAICDAIRKLKESITGKEAAHTLIVMIGIDRICMDFDFVDGGEPDKRAESSIEEKRKEFERKGAVVSTDEAEEKRQYAMKWMRYKRPIVKKAEAEGKTPEEIKQILQEAEAQFRLEQGFEAKEEASPEGRNGKTEEPMQPEVREQEAKSGAYNAIDDFIYVVKQGSRLGYHFCMALNSFADIKQTSLKPDFFRHKLSFQISVDDSRNLFGNKSASALPEHICLYDDSLERFSFRPYLHRGVTWEDWDVDEEGNVINSRSI